MTSVARWTRWAIEARNSVNAWRQRWTQLLNSQTLGNDKQSKVIQSEQHGEWSRRYLLRRTCLQKIHEKRQGVSSPSQLLWFNKIKYNKKNKSNFTQRHDSNRPHFSFYGHRIIYTDELWKECFCSTKITGDLTCMFMKLDLFFSVIQFCLRRLSSKTQVIKYLCQ